MLKGKKKSTVNTHTTTAATRWLADVSAVHEASI